MFKLKQFWDLIVNFFTVFQRMKIAFLLLEHYRVSGTPVVFFTLKDKKIVDCNCAFEFETGYSIEQLKKNTLDYFQWKKNEKSILHFKNFVKDLETSEEKFATHFVNSWKHGIYKTEIVMYWLVTRIEDIIVCELRVKPKT